MLEVLLDTWSKMNSGAAVQVRGIYLERRTVEIEQATTKHVGISS
jgi:hypothetical protein